MCQHVVGEWLGNPTHLPYPASPHHHHHHHHHHNNTTTNQLPLPSLIQKLPLPPSSRTAGPPRPPSANGQVRDPNHRNCHASGHGKVGVHGCMYGSVRFGSIHVHVLDCTENPTIHLSTHPSARARATQVIYFHHPSYPHLKYRWESPVLGHGMC